MVDHIIARRPDHPPDHYPDFSAALRFRRRTRLPAGDSACPLTTPRARVAETERWTTSHGIEDNAKWKYRAVIVLADVMVYVFELTSLNPRGYHISGYANRSVLHVARCYLPARTERGAGPCRASDESDAALLRQPRRFTTCLSRQ